MTINTISTHITYHISYRKQFQLICVSEKSRRKKEKVNYKMRTQKQSKFSTISKNFCQITKFQYIYTYIYVQTDISHQVWNFKVL